MILSFNPELFDSSDEELLKPLAQILRSDFADRHFVDLERLHPVLLDENGSYAFDQTQFSQEWFSSRDRIALKELFLALLDRDVYITNLVRKYVPRLDIGGGLGECSPAAALRIILEPARLVVENATNDWKFVRGVVEKYSRHPKRRSIYGLVKNAIDSNQLIAEQAGGKGQIKARLVDLSAHRYAGISKERLMTLFDSDRNNALSINHEQKSIISFLKNGKEIEIPGTGYDETDLVLWHMLYKREIENYVPIEVLDADARLRSAEKGHLQNLTASQLDFMDYDAFLEANDQISPKSAFPAMFLTNWSRDRLEARCSHHKVNIELPNGTLEEVSEIEYLLLKIVRII